MEPVINHNWNLSIKEAKKLQLDLVSNIRLGPFQINDLRTVVAVDVSYSRFDRTGYAVLGVFSVEYDNEKAGFRIKDCDIFERVDRVNFPYVPGYLSFREVPILLPLFRKVSVRPDVILVDGAGIAHPRGMGLASHIGVIFDVVSIGCAKSRLVGKYREPGRLKGDYSFLYYNGRRVGAVLRTKNNTKPLFVSPGNRIDIGSSVGIVLRFCEKYRLPEPIRLIDKRTKLLRKEFQKKGGDR